MNLPAPSGQAKNMTTTAPITFGSADQSEEIARAELYGLLAQLWLAPPDAELLEQFRVKTARVVLVEEQAAAGLELADRVVLMELGRVTWEGPRADLDVDRLTASYLGDAVDTETPAPA